MGPASACRCRRSAACDEWCPRGGTKSKQARYGSMRHCDIKCPRPRRHDPIRFPLPEGRQWLRHEDVAEIEPEEAFSNHVVLHQPGCRIRPGMIPRLPAVSEVGEAGHLPGIPHQATVQVSGNSRRNPCRYRDTSTRRDRSAASVGHHLVVYADDTATGSAYSGALSLTLPTDVAANAGSLQEPPATTGATGLRAPSRSRTR